MAKTGKTYRGQRNHYNPCGCYYCVGTKKDDLHRIEEEIVKKETNEILNNL